MRLDKFLAQSSIGKRKEVRIYIKEGKVRVNEKVVTVPAINIDEKIDKIEYLNNVVEYSEKVYYMFNKPSGCITAKIDKEHKTVFEFLSEEDKKGIFHVGRLDKDTEGLLLFTNDGDFEHKLMHPEKHVCKTYFFWALGSLSNENIKSLENGVNIIKGRVLTRTAKVKINDYGLFKDFEDELKKLNINLKNYNQSVVSGYITISEGRKHQVKRMLKAVGCNILYLKRIAIGEVVLDTKLNLGEYRHLTEKELQSLFSI